jgi:hypothetical protein
MPMDDRRDTHDEDNLEGSGDNDTDNDSDGAEPKSIIPLRALRRYCL